MKLLYDLEYEVNELREDIISQLQYDNLTIEEFMDLGVNNSRIRIDGKTYNLGYKWYRNGEYGYSSDYFGELNKEQLQCKIKLYDYDYEDWDYLNVVLELENEEDKKYFKRREE